MVCKIAYLQKIWVTGSLHKGWRDGRQHVLNGLRATYSHHRYSGIACFGNNCALILFVLGTVLMIR